MPPFERFILCMSCCVLFGLLVLLTAPYRFKFQKRFSLFCFSYSSYSLLASSGLSDESRANVFCFSLEKSATIRSNLEVLPLSATTFSTAIVSVACVEVSVAISCGVSFLHETKTIPKSSNPKYFMNNGFYKMPLALISRYLLMLSTVRSSGLVSTE